MIYLVDVAGLGLVEAAWYAWVPPLAANAGGLLGGWMSYWRLARRTSTAEGARRWVCRWAAVALLATAALPLLQGATWATTAISWSFFWTAAFSVNLYTIPLDRYGRRSAAFTVSLLTSAYGFMQAVASPVIGALVDSYGFAPVCVLAALFPMAAYLTLQIRFPSKTPTMG